MKRTRRIAWWTAYGLASAATVAGLAWLTARTVRSEHEERAARRETEQQETVRLALWRMDSWLAPRLARESARTWFEYESYHPQTLAYNRLLEPIAQGEVLVPSPLLALSSRHFPLHFQWRAGAGFTSPQVPPSVLVEQGEVGCTPVILDQRRVALLAKTAGAIDPEWLDRRVSDAEMRLEATLADEAEPASGAPTDRSADARAALDDGASVGTGGAIAPATQSAVAAPWTAKSKLDQSRADLKARASASNYAQRAYPEEVIAQQTLLDNSLAQTDESDSAFAPIQTGASDATVVATTVEVGALLPVWLTREPPSLVFARRVRVGNERILQGFLVNWDVLRSELLGQIADVLPGAELVPCFGAQARDESSLLASIPATLKVPPGAFGPSPDDLPAGLGGLVIVWLAAVGAIAASGLALRSSIGSAVRTSRFASSVTHELRTPLTTFRLYSEMLADGIVKDPEKVASYLATLRDESSRLGLLVENVLAWSRVEEGRSPREARSTGALELLAEVEPVLRRRCDEAKVNFSSRPHDDLPLVTDAERVRQILFNLVDNACKYAGAGAHVTLATSRENGSLLLAIEDDGPGVPARLRRRIFRAFDRGDRGPGDGVRGLGLGLAISNDLARSLGGRLHCESSASGGARFALELPIES